MPSQISQRRLWSNQEKTHARDGQGGSGILQCLGHNVEESQAEQEGDDSERAGQGIKCSEVGVAALKDFRVVREMGTRRQDPGTVS